MKRKPLTVHPEGADYEVRIVGGRPRPLRDFYHALLQLSWWATVATICVVFVVANAVFAVAYVVVGGIEHAVPGSFLDAFFFSVQTMGTIGYGAMFPGSTAANTVVVIESIASLLLTAVSTGLVVAKFSRPTARVVFTRSAVISLFDGVPTLMFRLGNERGNRIVDARIQAVLYRTERMSDGSTYYRQFDLRLSRGQVVSLTRSWNVRHPIDEASPLRGDTPESLREQEVELEVMVIGLDDVSMQTVHASHQYFAKDIVWGAKLADVLSEEGKGRLLLDLRRFHDIEPTLPTADFPYP